MKVIDTPRTGRLGPVVFYPSPFGQCARSLTTPHDPKSEAQSRMRANFGSSSRGWSLKLSEPQRERWAAVAQTVPSHPSLSQYSHLSGQQLCVKINSTLRCIGQPQTGEPPAPVVFSPNPVGGLAILNDPESGVRLRLNVGTLSEDIMVFGQPACSAGRMKQRRVYYLGLAGPATNGQCDITDLYTARFGQPRPGQKVFIVTCQTRNGWKARPSVFSAVVPPPTQLGEQEVTAATKVTTPAAPATPEVPAAAVQGTSSLHRAVYKGSTRDAQQVHKVFKRVHPVSIRCTHIVHSVRVALRRLGMLGRWGWAAGPMK